MNKYIIYYHRNGSYYRTGVHADNSNQAMLRMVDFYKYRVEVIMFFNSTPFGEDIALTERFEKENNVILETDIN